MRAALWSIIGASLVSSLHPGLRSLLELDQIKSEPTSSFFSTRGDTVDSSSSSSSPLIFKSSSPPPSSSNSATVISSSSSSSFKAAPSSSSSSFAIRSTDDEELTSSTTPKSLTTTTHITTASDGDGDGSSSTKKVSTWGQRWNPTLQRIFSKQKVEEEDDDGTDTPKSATKPSVLETTAGTQTVGSPTSKQMPSISAIQAPAHSSATETTESKTSTSENETSSKHAELMRKGVEAAKSLWKTIQTTAGTEVVPSINNLGQKLTDATSSFMGKNSAAQKSEDEEEDEEVEGTKTETTPATKKENIEDETEEEEVTGGTEEKRALQEMDGKVSSMTTKSVQTARVVPQDEQVKPFGKGKKGKHLKGKQNQNKTGDEVPLSNGVAATSDSSTAASTASNDQSSKPIFFSESQTSGTNTESTTTKPSSSQTGSSTSAVLPSRFDSIANAPISSEPSSTITSASETDSESNSFSSQPLTSSTSSSAATSESSPPALLDSSRSTPDTPSSSTASSNSSTSSISELASTLSSTASSLVSSLLNTSVAKAVLPPRFSSTPATSTSANTSFSSSDPSSSVFSHSTALPSTGSNTEKTAPTLTTAEFKIEEEADDNADADPTKSSSITADTITTKDQAESDNVNDSVTSATDSSSTTAATREGKFQHAGIKEADEPRSSPQQGGKSKQVDDDVTDNQDDADAEPSKPIALTPPSANFSLSNPFSPSDDNVLSKPLPPIISDSDSSNSLPSSSFGSSSSSLSSSSSSSSLSSSSSSSLSSSSSSSLSSSSSSLSSPSDTSSDTSTFGSSVTTTNKSETALDATSTSGSINTDDNDRDELGGTKASEVVIQKPNIKPFTNSFPSSLGEDDEEDREKISSKPIDSFSSDQNDKVVDDLFNKPAATKPSDIDGRPASPADDYEVDTPFIQTDTMTTKPQPESSDSTVLKAVPADTTTSKAEPGGYVAVRMSVVFKLSVLELDLKPPRLWEMLHADLASALNTQSSRFEMSQISDDRHVEFQILPSHTSDASSTQLAEQFKTLIKGSDIPDGILTHIESIEKTEIIPSCEDGSFSKMCGAKLETVKGSNWMYYLGGIIIVGAGVFFVRSRREPAMTKTVHGAKFARVKSEEDISPPRVSSAGETSTEFVERVLSRLGIPTYGMAKYTNMLKDKHLHTLEQLKAMDDADWRAVGLPPVIESGLKEALTGRAAPPSREGRSGGMELTRSKPSSRMDRVEDFPKSRLASSIDTDTVNPTDAWDLDMPDEDLTPSPVVPVKEYAPSKKSTVVIPEEKDPEAPSADSELTSDKPVAPKTRPKPKATASSKSTKPVQKKAVSEVQEEGDGWNMDMDDF